MHTLTARRGALLLVVILFLVAILLEQAIAAVCPWLGQMGGVRPSIVFLDIPLEAPVTVDWMPVGFIFLLFYGLVGGGRAEEKPKGEIRRRGWAIVGRWWLLLICLLFGGGLFFLVGDFLPKAVRNGLDSFGMRADLILPYPAGETVHLHGSMIILVFFVLGWRSLINTAAPPKAATPPKVVAPPKAAAPPKVVAPPKTIASPKTAAPLPAPAETAIPGQERLVMRIAEPVELRSPGGRPCVYVSMPNGLEQKRKSYPCVVEGGIKPAGIRRKDPQGWTV